MTPYDEHEELRLLPWVSDTGKPCYLSSADGPQGPVSRLADEVEAAQLADATAVLADTQAVLDEPAAVALALRLALKASTGALTNTLRIATSRGARPDPYGTGGTPAGQPK